MKFKRILLALLVLGGLSPSAWAEDEPTVVYLKPDVSKALSIEDIQNDDLTFVIMNSSNQVLYIESGNNYSLATLDDVVSGDYITMAFKMESVNDADKDVEGYMFPCYTKNLAEPCQAADRAMTRYLNSQPANPGVLFGYPHWNSTYSYGTDANYHGLWQLNASTTATGAYSIKNVGTKGYLTGVSGAHGTSAVDWFFYPISITNYITNYTTNNDIVNITDLVATWSGKSETSTAAGLSMGGRFQKTTVGAGDVITQKITGLKNGTYEVTLYAGASRAVYSDCSVSSDEGSGLSEVFANRVSQGIDVVTRQKIDSFVPITFEVAVLDGTLTYGIRNIKAAGNWFVLKAKSIVYTSEDITDNAYLNLIADKKATAEGISGAMNAGVKSALESAISGAESSKLTGKTTDELKAIYETLVTAVDNANASVTAYAGAKSALTKVYEQAQSNSTNVLSSDAYETYYTTPRAKYDAGTLTTEEAATLGEKGFSRYMLSAWDNNEDPEDYYLNTWSTEGNSDGSNFTTPFYEYYIADMSKLGTKTLTATITGLTANADYEISTWTRVHVTSDKGTDGKAVATTATPYGISLQVGEGTSVNVCSGTQIGTGQYYIGNYTARGTADSDGKLTVKYVVAEDNNVNWLAFKNVWCEKIASESDVTSLKTSIENKINTAKATYAATPGFDAGEYAPYIYTTVINSLNNALSLISGDKLYESDYEAAQAIYDETNLTANTEEVNAIYDPDFSIAEANAAPFGWSMTEGQTLGGDYKSRAYVKSPNLTEFNATNSVFFIRFDGQYGNTKTTVDGVQIENKEGASMEYYYGKTEGYSLPLKANTVYAVEFDVKNWGHTKISPVQVSVSGPNDFTTASATVYTEAVDADKEDSKPVHATAWFRTSSAGDYYITLRNLSGELRNFVVSNFNLKKYTFDTETRSTATGKYGTISLPYAFEATGADVYEVARVSDGVVYMYKVEGVAEAGKAYIYQATADAQTFAIGEGSVVNEPVAGTLTGVFTATTAPTDSYVLQTQNGVQQFYKATSGNEPNIPAYRAYLKVEEAASEAAYRIAFGSTTAVEAVKALTDENVQIYDLNGRKLNKLQKGFNVVNGIKIFVK